MRLTLYTILTRRVVIAAVVAIVLLCVFGAAIYSLSLLSDAGVYTRATSIATDLNAPELDRALALTFDDGPDPRVTPQILQMLADYDIPATFFLVGENIAKHPFLTRQIVNRGFEIGNHSFTHQHDVHASSERIHREIAGTDRLLALITGRSTTMYRPPELLDIGFGEILGTKIPDEALRIAESAGMAIIGTDADPQDWRFHEGTPGSARIIYERLVEEIENGGRVILLHDTHPATAEALALFIPEMLGRGYSFVPASRFLGMTPEEAMPPVPPSRVARDGIVMATLVVAALGGSLIYVIALLVLIITFARMSLIVIFSRALTEKTRPKNVAAHVPSRSGTLRFSWPSQSPPLPMTVLIPAYNEEANIEGTIRSLLASVHPPEQIVVIDDGSIDETSRIVLRLIDEHGSKITLLQKMNEGSKAKALSYALPFVRNSIIVCIDADTIIEKNALTYITHAFRDPSVGAIAGKVYPANTRSLIERFQFLEYVQGQNLEKLVFSLGNAITVVPGALGAWRLKAIREIGGFPIDTLVEDQDATLALLSNNWRVIYEERAVAYTETPATVRSFFKQRFRWTYGTLQCFRKYEHLLGNRQNSALGFIVLPNMILFNIVLPLLVPLIDSVLLISLFTAPTQTTALMALLALIFFITIDTLYLTEALRFEKIHWRDYLVPLILQRWFYRYMMAAAIIKSLYVAFFRKTVGWGALHREGHAQRVWALWASRSTASTSVIS